MGSLSIQKGKRAERQIAALLTPVVQRVAIKLGVAPYKVTRNLAQAQKGGFDLDCGGDWAAIEVKHHAELRGLPGWWAQCLQQAGPRDTSLQGSALQGGSDTTLQGGSRLHYRGANGAYLREPILIYKANGGRWKVRMFGRLEIEPGRRLRVPVDISMDDFLAWFERRLEVELKSALSEDKGGDAGLFD